MLSLRNSFILARPLLVHRVSKINYSEKKDNKTSIYSEHQDRIVNQNYDVLNFETNYLYFTGFNEMGFHTNMGLRIVGPCAAFRKSTLFWNVKTALDINEAKLSLFTILEPKLDILVIGKGKPSDPIDTHFIQRVMKKHNIGVEILDTERALTTFNFLNSEGRYVAAGLIPANFIDLHADEREKMKERRQSKDLFEMDVGPPLYLDSSSVDLLEDNETVDLKNWKSYDIKDVVRPDKKMQKLREEKLSKSESDDKDKKT